jgi:hypothetical protein
VQLGDICPWLVSHFPDQRADANGAFDLEVVRQSRSRKLGLGVHHFGVLNAHAFPTGMTFDSFSGVAPSFRVKNISDTTAARDVELYLACGHSLLAFAFSSFAPAMSSARCNVHDTTNDDASCHGRSRFSSIL